MPDRSLRGAGIALAVVAGAIHLALSRVDLIPGETTAVPAFALMAAGFVACAALVAFARGDLLVIVPVYSISLVGAYLVTRGRFPVEAWGVTSQAAELALAGVGVALFRRSQSVAARRPVPGRS